MIRRAGQLPETGGRRRAGLRRVTSALADIGPSSAASMVVGLLAIRLLDPDELGVYSMLYACAFLVAVAPTQVVFLPRERAVATEVPSPDRAGRQAWRAVGPAVGIGLAGNLVTLALAAYLYQQEGSTTTLLLGAGAVALAVVSPVQDYVRRLAHILDRGPVAVVTSVVQLLLVLLFAAVALAGTAWEAGALLIAVLAVSNMTSAAAGLALLACPSRSSRPRPPRGAVQRDEPGGAVRTPDPDPAETTATPGSAGARQRVAGGLAPDVSFTIGNLLIERLGGLAMVGAAEAARQIAQPVMLVGAAATNVLARKALRAGAYGDARAARRSRLLAAAGVVLAVGVVLALCYLPPTSRWVQSFAPVAFSESWLVPLTCLAHAVVVVGMVLTLELIGARRERVFLRVEGTAAAALLGVCAAAGVLGAATRPVAVLFSGLVRLGGAGAALTHRYATASSPGSRSGGQGTAETVAAAANTPGHPVSGN